MSVILGIPITGSPEAGRERQPYFSDEAPALFGSGVGDVDLPDTGAGRQAFGWLTSSLESGHVERPH